MLRFLGVTDEEAERAWDLAVWAEARSCAFGDARHHNKKMTKTEKEVVVWKDPASEEQAALWTNLASVRLRLRLQLAQVRRRQNGCRRAMVGFTGAARVRRQRWRLQQKKSVSAQAAWSTLGEVIRRRSVVRPRIRSSRVEWVMQLSRFERSRCPYQGKGGSLSRLWATRQWGGEDEECVLAVPEDPAPSTMNEFRGACSFATEEQAGVVEWHQLVTLFDTAAMPNCVLESAVKPHWKWLEREPSRVRGVGGSTVNTVGRVVVPGHSMVYQGRRMGLVANVVRELPRGIQLLVGLETIQGKAYHIVTDPAGFRVHIRATKEVVRLDRLVDVVWRQGQGEQWMLSLCSGLLPELGVMLELGWNAYAVCVERSTILCRMLACHGSRVQVHCADVTSKEVFQLV
jgi:hypothetical protein